MSDATQTIGVTGPWTPLARHERLSEGSECNFFEFSNLSPASDHMITAQNVQLAENEYSRSLWDDMSKRSLSVEHNPKEGAIHNPVMTAPSLNTNQVLHSSDEIEKTVRNVIGPKLGAEQRSDALKDSRKLSISMSFCPPSEMLILIGSSLTFPPPNYYTKPARSA